MYRRAHKKLSPFIEGLILHYEEGADRSSSGCLKAHVIGVGDMSPSEALDTNGHVGLLYLSDEVLMIPALLTSSAWESIQEAEERDCFSSLLNTTICIKEYQLKFHMNEEQTKCKFYLSVGALAMTAAGPIRENPPCCTTLRSVRIKICQTWRSRMGQASQESQLSQCELELSELLGEWQKDCLQVVLEDVEERLTEARPTNPHPSTSSSTASPKHNLHKFPATSLDIDRLRFKGEKCFTIPRCLLKLEEDAQQLQTPTNDGGRTQSGLSSSLEAREQDLPQGCKPTEGTQPSVDDVEWKIARPTIVHSVCEASEAPPDPDKDATLHENIVAGMFDSNRPLANPWDIFPPPCETSSSSSRASPEEPQTESLQNPTAAVSGPAHDTHLSHQNLEETGPTLEQSCLKPYQNPPHSACLLPAHISSTSVSPPVPFLTDLGTSRDQHCNDTVQLKLSATDQDGEISEDDEGTEEIQRRCRNAKRKRCKSTPEDRGTTVKDKGEETLMSTSPPSWLFDTQGGSGLEEVSGQEQYQTVGTVKRKTPNMHNDGSKFSYSYKVSRQNLEDLRHFKVSKQVLNWAVKYLLVPDQIENAPDLSGTSNQTTSDRN